jgi:hypothetical protein
MKYQRAVYSIVQFRPDASRLEGVNVGVVVFVEDTAKMEIRMASHGRRVAQFFGASNLRFVQQAKRALVESLNRSEISTVAHFNEFRSRLANSLVMTEPRPMKVADLANDTSNLFERLVEETTEHRTRAQRMLTERFRSAGVVGLVEKSVEITLDHLELPLRVPYAYQNGRFNLLAPVEFRDDSKDLISKVGEKALQSELLKQTNAEKMRAMHLVVIAQFSDQLSFAARQFIQSTLHSHDIGLYTFDNLDPLIADIRHSHELHSVTQNDTKN